MYRNEALDGVLICTPTYTHEEMVRRALARRVPVMCEKPLALDAETARRLVAEAADADVPFMVMQVVRFWPEYRALARLIRSGQLGRIKNVYMSRLSSHPDWTVWHRDPEKSGGGLYDLHIHELDFLYSVFGPAETVYAIGDREENGCFNNVSTCLRFSSGVPAVAEGFMDMTGDFPFSASFRVNGERASVVYESRDGAMTLYKADKPGEELEIPRYDPYREETEYFADCVRSKKGDRAHPGDGRDLCSGTIGCGKGIPGFGEGGEAFAGFWKIRKEPACGKVSLCGMERRTLRSGGIRRGGPHGLRPGIASHQ